MYPPVRQLALGPPPGRALEVLRRILGAAAALVALARARSLRGRPPARAGLEEA